MDFARKELVMIFTCSKCNTRAAKAFSKKAYTTGVVIVDCPGCHSKHLIADHLGWWVACARACVCMRTLLLPHTWAGGWRVCVHPFLSSHTWAGGWLVCVCALLEGGACRTHDTWPSSVGSA